MGNGGDPGDQKMPADINIARAGGVKLSYNDLGAQTGQFLIPKKTFTQQFSQIYFVRLQSIRPTVLARSKQRWGEVKHIARVLDVETNMDSFIIGTIFCDKILRPNIFEELGLTEAEKKVSGNAEGKFFDGPIQVFLEDESGRVELEITNAHFYPWVTGITVAVRGKVNELGKFVVVDICEAGLAPQVPRKPLSSTPSTSPRYVAFVSGLNYGSNSHSSLETDMLLQFLNGDIMNEFSEKIVRVVIAGNTCPRPEKISNEFKKKYGHEVAKYRTDHLIEVDERLSGVASACELDIMPGETDLANESMPQSPIISSLFPNLSSFSSVHFVGNPYNFELDSVRFLGVAGQNVDDIFKYVNEENRLTIAEHTMLWRHMCPTAPDTLWSFPFFDKDPFIVTETPHVYFIGNQPKFSTKIVKGSDGEEVRIILIPSFSETKSLCLLNLEDMSVMTLSLSSI